MALPLIKSISHRQVRIEYAINFSIPVVQTPLNMKQGPIAGPLAQITGSPSVVRQGMPMTPMSAFKTPRVSKMITFEKKKEVAQAPKKRRRSLNAYYQSLQDRMSFYADDLGKRYLLLNNYKTPGTSMKRPSSFDSESLEMPDWKKPCVTSSPIKYHMKEAAVNNFANGFYLMTTDEVSEKKGASQENLLKPISFFENVSNHSLSAYRAAEDSETTEEREIFMKPYLPRPLPEEETHDNFNGNPSSDLSIFKQANDSLHFDN